MTLTSLLSSLIITIVPLGGQLPNSDDICGWEVWGTYYEWQIWICEWSEQYVIKHEEWHFIEDKYLTEAQREQYKALYSKHHKLGVRAFQRDYGYSDWQESFAEDYSSWKTNESVNIYTKQRIKLIKSLLK